MKNITKKFDTVTVLNNVDFDLRKGEVHALVGANGAGKSTLMKILNGILINYEGDIILNNEKVTFVNPLDAFEHGVLMIHQELDLAENLDVSENIYLGRELKKGGVFSAIDRSTMRKKVQKLLDLLEFPIKSTELVGNLSPAMQQLVLIARVVELNAKVVVMDEPTSSLSISEIEKLFKVIKDLCDKGISVIYISHFLDEVFRISDRVTVLRNGEKIITKDVEDCTTKQIVEWMVGHKEIGSRNYIRDEVENTNVMKINGLTQKDGIVKNVSFDLKKGEILGIAGVVGSGKTELAKMIFGAEKIASGTIMIDGKPVTIKCPAKAVSNQIAFIPEDRKKEGVILGRSVTQNLSLTGLKDNTRLGVIDYDKVDSKAGKMIDYMSIKCSSCKQEVRYLSGGNQQKIVIGKWLSINSKIIIMDQPTRGVDVGAKDEIYQLVHTLAKQGASIIFISDEIEEILCLADRVLVMKKGEIVGEFENCQRKLTKVDLLTSMVGDEDTCGQVVI